MKTNGHDENRKLNISNQDCGFLSASIVSLSSYLSPIPDAHRFLVARIDASEVYGPLIERLWVLIAVVFALLLVSAATLVVLWRHRHMRYNNKELEQQVIERTVQLENTNKELESFSYSVSHDLRAPLRGIDGFSSILLEDYSGKIDKEGRRLLNVIRENIKKMGHLIDDLLAFSRIGRHELDRSDIDMKTLANSIYQELTSGPERERISFSVADLPPLNGDASMMRQLWYNLISNALKFSSKKEKAKIEIGFKCEDGNNIYFIRDNGVGFDMKYYGKLFGVFQRLHSEAEYKGTGVGLAIVKSIVTKHGGKIRAESELNVGTTFYFSV